jgi:hypothetical protein
MTITARTKPENAPHDGRKATMAVMVTFTLKTDKATYQRLADARLGDSSGPAVSLQSRSGKPGRDYGFLAKRRGLGRVLGRTVAQGMKMANIVPPDDLKISPLINANAR